MKDEGYEQRVEKYIGHKAFIIIFLIIILILLVCGYMFSSKINSKEKSKSKDKNDVQMDLPISKEEDKNEFNYNSEIGYGTATVVGYATTEQVSDSDIAYPLAPVYDMIYFNVVETKNDSFLRFLKDYEGNTYLGDKKFAIGCLQNDKIIYYNDSDETGMKEYELSVDETEKIMNSTKNSLVKLEIEIFKHTSGMGAPKCYSWISTISVKQ